MLDLVEGVLSEFAERACSRCARELWEGLRICVRRDVETSREYQRWYDKLHRQDPEYRRKKNEYRNERRARRLALGLPRD